MTAYPLSFLVRTASSSGEISQPGSITAQADAVSVVAGNPITISPLANDTSSDGTPLSISSIITHPLQGALSKLSDTQLRYIAPTIAGTYSARIAVRSGSGGSAESTITFTVTAATGGGEPTPTGLSVPWGGGQLGGLVGAGKAWNNHYGHSPTAVAGWTDYKQLTSPTIFAGGSMGTGLDTYNDLFNGKWNYNITNPLSALKTNTLMVWVFPFQPTNWYVDYKAGAANPNMGIYGTFKTGGSNNTTWKNMWYAVGFRTAAMIKRLGGAYDKFIMDVGWEMTNKTYGWSVGNSEADYRTARMIACDSFREGANKFDTPASAGDKIRWMLRVSANKNSGQLANLWTDKDHDPIVGRSWHENYPLASLGAGRPWHKKSGWEAEVNGTWGGHKLDEVAQFAVDRGLKIGQSEVGHAKEPVTDYEQPSESPVTAVDKIFWWCKRWETHLHHWCWLHSSNRPMLPPAPPLWKTETFGGKTYKVEDRIRDLFNGTATPTLKDTYTGGN